MSDSSDIEDDNSVEINKLLDYLDSMFILKKLPILTDKERCILTGSWNNETYEKIADSCTYSSGYLSQDIAPSLWERLETILSLPIGKKSFKQIIKRYYHENPLLTVEDKSNQSNIREHIYIRIDGEISTVKLLLDAIQKKLEYCTGDISIHIERKVIPGSTIFFCNGTVRSMNRLVSMFAEGNLTEVAGLRILDLNFMRVWLERLFSNSWEEAEQILSRSGNRNIRSGDDSASPTSSSLTKARLVQVADNIQLIIVAKIEYKSALETIITFSIYPNSEPYLPTNLTIEVLDSAGSIVMEERIAAPNIDAIEVPFTIEIEEHFSLRITDRDREIIEQF